MPINWGDAPGWAALGVVLVDWVVRISSWRKRRNQERLQRQREIESRRLSESDLKMLRAVRDSDGTIVIQTTVQNGSRVVTKMGGMNTFYDTDTSKEVHAKHVARLERLWRLGLLKEAGGFSGQRASERNFQLSDKAYDILKDAPASGEVIASEFGE